MRKIESPFEEGVHTAHSRDGGCWYLPSFREAFSRFSGISNPFLFVSDGPFFYKKGEKARQNPNAKVPCL